MAHPSRRRSAVQRVRGADSDGRVLSELLKQAYMRVQTTPCSLTAAYAFLCKDDAHAQIGARTTVGEVLSWQGRSSAVHYEAAVVTSPVSHCRPF